MINARDEILRLMLSKNITLDEFNFDQLSAPPLDFFLSQHDIDYLVYLANSPKFSSKINYKYDEIDKLMKSRGFRLLGRGTNRVVYRNLEYYDICLKIAIDHIGSSDNPKEFINQEYLKPYVSKIFSVDPTGTVAVSERVHPISTREEFEKYSYAIYDLITKYFIGKYVVNDIGTKYFMNWGIRYSTSLPVLLDYPYFYLFDPRKAVCHTIFEDGSICNGDIDYDNGYNTLFCTKCGRQYKAAELAKEQLTNANNIVSGGNKMKAIITIKKGSNVTKVVSNPETKKLEDRYSYSANVSVKKVKQAIDNVVKENTLRNKASDKTTNKPKLPVQVKKTNEPKYYNNRDKNGRFVQKGGNNKPKIAKKKIAINTGTTTIVADKEKLSQFKSSVKVNKKVVDKKNDNIIIEDNIKQNDDFEISKSNESDKLADKVYDALTSVTSAKDETSIVNEDGVHIEDESHIEEDITPSKETEINVNDTDTEDIDSEMIIKSNNIVQTETFDLYALPTATDQTTNDIAQEDIQESIEEPANDETSSIDLEEESNEATEEISDEEKESSEEKDNEAVQQEFERLMNKKKSKKKSSKYDPDFYNKNSSRRNS